MKNDGYSTTALNALSKGQYKALRTNALASRKREDARKRVPEVKKTKPVNLANPNKSDPSPEKKPSTRYTNETQKGFLDGKINDYAKAHPKISTLNSFTMAPGATLEGIEAALGGLLGQNAYDMITGKKFGKNNSVLDARMSVIDPLAATKAKEGIRQGVQDEIDSKGGKFLYNTGTGLADMGINMAMSGGNPVAMGVVSGAQNAAQNTLHAMERGVDENKARQTGLATGVVAGIMNSVGLDSVLKSTAKTVLGQALQGAGKEGLENVVEDITDTFLDDLINGKNSEIRQTVEYYKNNGQTDEEAVKSTFNDYLKQEAESFISGAGFGAAIGGGKRVLGSALPQLGATIDSKLTERKLKNSSDAIQGIMNGDITSAEQLRVPNVIDNAKAQAENAQAEIERLNQQIPEVPEEAPTIEEAVANQMQAAGETALPNRWGRTADSMIAEDSYARGEDFKKLENNIRDLNEQIFDLKDKLYALRQERDANAGRIQLTKDDLETIQSMDVEDRMAYIEKATGIDMGEIGAADLEYLLEGRAIKRSSAKTDEIDAQIKDLEAQRTELEKQLSLLEEDRDYIKANERIAQLENYTSNEFVPATREKYQGFSTTKGEHNNEIGKGAQLVEMTPDEYIQRCVYEVFEESDTDSPATLESVLSSRYQSKVDEYAQKMREGAEFPTPYIDYTSGFNQEGLHRALAAKEAGIDVIPVVVKGYPTDQRLLGSNARIRRSEIELARNERELERLGFEDLVDEDILDEDIDSAVADSVAEELNKVPTVKNPVEADQESLNKLITSKKTGSIETDNGQVIEKYSMKDMRENVKNIKQNGLEDGEQLYIRYKDGTEVAYSSGDDTSGIKLTNIDSVVWNNANTDAFAGSNITIYPEGNEGDMRWYVATGNESAPSANVEEPTQPLVPTVQQTTEVETPKAEVPTVQPTEVPNAEVPNTPEPPAPDGENYGESRVVNHSAINADIITQEELDNDPVLQEIAKYAKHNNETTYNNALDNVKKNGQKLLDDYIDGSRVIDNDTDVDQSMILLRGLSEKLRNGDTSVKAQRDLLLSRLRAAGTKYGQTIQAFAKWNGTAEGAQINGERILAGRRKDWESRNQKKANQNKKAAENLSKIPATVDYDGTKISNGGVPKVNPNQTNGKLNNALKQQGYDGSMDIPKEPKTFDQLKKEVINSLKKEYGSINNKFSNDDIDYLTNLIAEGATTDELADAINTKMATGTFGLSADTQNKVNLLFEEANKYDPDSKKACEAKAMAYKLIADETVGDASAYEKFEAWRYLAMLGNPKTMFRNFVGNTTFNVVTGVSNGLSSILEAATDYSIRGGKWASNKLFKTNYDTSQGIQRTKSLASLLPTAKNKELMKSTWDDAYNSRYKEMQGQKYEKGVREEIESSKSVFNSKLAQLYEKLTDAGISDTLAVRTKYSTSLAGYLRANGLDASVFEADNRFKALEAESRKRVLTDTEKAELEDLRSDHEKLEKARDYAVSEAEYSTFHEDNEVAALLSKFSRDARNSKNPVGKGIGYIFEGIMPFKKTPANIVRSGYDFSPFGAISSIAKTGKLIYENVGKNKGNLADTYTTKSGRQVNRTLASDVIESWSRNLTGTGMMMLGYYLKNKGILNSSDKDELYQDELEGKQNYSITINGHTYTIDWAAPASMSLLMGAELAKIVERSSIPGKKVYENVGDVIGTVNSLIDPIVETSMMQGVKNTLESAASVARYDDNAGAGLGVLGTMAANAGLNYVSQVVPTILGQAARVVDPVRRSTDTVSPNSFVAGMEKQGRKMMNKIPFLSMLNNPYVNARGEEELNSPSANPLASIPYQFISPGYLQDINPTKADESARQVYNAEIPSGKLDENGNPILTPQMDKGVFETWKSKVTVGDHKLTPDEMYQYRTTAGQANESIRTALADEEWFNNLDPQQQNDLLKSVNTFVDKLGKDTVGYPQDDKALDVYKEGGIPSLLEYYQQKEVKKQVQNETGLSAQAKKTAEITDALINGRTEEANQMIAEEVQKQEAVKPYEEPAEALGISAKDYGTIKTYAGSSWNKVEPELPKLKGMGVTNYSQYAHAVKYAESNNQSIDPNWFANQTKQLDTDKSGGVSQDELITYFNDKNMSEAEVMRLWGMLALGKDGAEPKNVPHILTRGKNKGKWGR